MELALFGGSPADWMIIAVVALVIFGAPKVPQLMRGLGEGIKEFKKAVADDEPSGTGIAPAPPTQQSASPAPPTEQPTTPPAPPPPAPSA